MELNGGRGELLKRLAKRPGISEQLWGLFPMLYSTWDKYAFDLIGNIAVPIDNYISRGTDVFVTGTAVNGSRYTNMVMDMCVRVLKDSRQTEKEARTAAQLLMVVLHHCKGRVDEYVPSMLEILVERVKTAKKAELKSALLETISSALFYDPNLTLRWSEAKHATQDILTHLFVSLEAEVFDTNLGKKLVALGLTSLLSLPITTLPAPVTQVLPHAFSAVVKLVTEEVKYLEDIAQEAAKAAEGGGDGNNEEEEEEDEEEEEEDDEGEDGFDENQDVKNEEDMIYMKNFHPTAQEDIDQYLQDWNDEDEEDEEFSTPIDDVNLRIFFYDSFRVANDREPEAMLHLQQQLKPDILKECQSHFAEAQKEKAAVEAAAAAGTAVAT